MPTETAILAVHAAAAAADSVLCKNCNDTGLRITFDDKEVYYTPCPYCGEIENKG